MKIVMMNGGLGNQLFQYILFRFIEVLSGDTCYIDDRFFYVASQHNGYELEKIFGLKPNLLSEYFDKDVWDEIVRVTQKECNIVDYFARMGLPLALCSEGSNYVVDHKNHDTPFLGEYTVVTMNQYAPNIAPQEGNLYYYGYWINRLWFLRVRDEVLKDLVFPPFDDDYNKGLAEQIASCNSVAVHVRRGDFAEYGLLLDVNWYRNSVAEMKVCVGPDRFFLFSDEPDWCRQNLSALGFTGEDKVEIVAGNVGGKNFRDMQLMSLCRNMIIANSSFSYLAALLNQNPNKFVLNPVDFRAIV